MERAMLGVSLKDKIRNEMISRKTSDQYKSEKLVGRSGNGRVRQNQ